MFSPPHSHAGFTNPPQYQIFHECGPRFDGKRLRELPDPIPARDEIIPDPDSIPLTILIYPLGLKHEGPLDVYNDVPAAPSEKELNTV